MNLQQVAQHRGAGSTGGGGGIWQKKYLVSDCVISLFLHHQHIVPNLSASAASQSPIKEPDHSDKVTDLMLSDIIKLSI